MKLKKIEMLEKDTKGCEELNVKLSSSKQQPLMK